MSVRANDVNRRTRRLMAGIAPGKLLGILQEGWSRRQIPETDPGRRPGDRGGNRLPGRRRPRPSDHLAEATEQGPLDPDELATTILS